MAFGAPKPGSNKSIEFGFDPGGQFFSGKWKPFGEGQKLQAYQLPDSPELKQLYESQLEQAKGFREGKERLKADQMGIAGETGRIGLARQMAGINRGYGGRGLLYSGLRQADQSGAMGGLASKLASQRQDINKAVDEQSRQMDLGAADTGMQLRDLEQQKNQLAYQDALARYQARQGENKGFGMLTKRFNPLFGGSSI